MAKHFAKSSASHTANLQPLSSEGATEKTPSLKDSVPSLGDTDMYVALNEEQIKANQLNEPSQATESPEEQADDLTVIAPLDSAELGEKEEAPVVHKKHQWWKIPVVLVGVLALVYVGGAIFFNFFFMPQTNIYGKDYSLKPASDLQTSRANEASNYSVQVSGNGVDLTIKASDIDLTYDAAGYAHDAISQQNPWMWPLEITRSRSLSPHATASYDTSKADALFNQRIEQAKESAQALENNGITYDSSAKKFIFADDAIATRLSLEGVHKDLQTAFDNLTTTVQLGPESLMSAEDLDAALKTANSYVASAVDLMLGDSVAYQLDQDTIASWIKFDENLSISFDTDAITKWVNETLAPAVDTRGTSRTYKRWDGKEFTTKAAGAYGWVIDNDAAIKAISDGLSAGQATKIELPTKQSADKFTKQGEQDWGGRYIDVDLTTQHAVLYGDDGTILWEADVVTGIPDGHHNTPEGVWYITSHIRDARLLGPNDESGRPGWDTKVDFWLGVKGQEVGFHNAPWRSAFGGNIYRTGGSHGCINLSYENAQKLFDIAKDGDPVIIHY